MRARLRIALLAGLVALGGLPLAGTQTTALATPNPVATDESTYQAYGRVFPDPHGCLAYGVPDTTGDGIKDTPRGVSPWAKGRACATQFLSYEEVIEGAKFLQRRFPEFINVIRLDQAYDNPNYMSAGLPRLIVTDDGKPKLLGRDRRPLYMIKLTDKTSTIPEKDRLHFSYTLSIHGIERAGVEGGSRAMEDMVTWAACELPKYRTPVAPTLPAPACGVEGPFPKKLVETPSTFPVPTAGDALKSSVVYFVFPNPDGWARGQVAPIEIEDGAPNANYTPGFFFQRYNGNGVDVNRNWPTRGYTYKPYLPGAQPETKAFGEVLKKIRGATSGNRFAGAIDLHGMITAYAFSYTLIGAGQRDYRKNTVTVETSIRSWEDQTKRMSWSPYIADTNANGVNDAGETCVNDPSSIAIGSGTRPRIPACVADEWGTVIDTIGYQITGGLGDWMDSSLGLDAIGIDNEMYASHLAPNTAFDPALEQTHIDGNKGLIFSQIAALVTAGPTTFTPVGKVGYVHNPMRLEVDESQRPKNPGLPAQNDIDVIVPCQDAVAQNIDEALPCGGATYNAADSALEFEVKGPVEGVWNGGVTVTSTAVNALGVSHGTFNAIQLQHYDEGQWHTLATSYHQGSLVGTTDLYLPAGEIVTANDPSPGRYRVWWSNPATMPQRVKIDFNPETAEASPGQAEIDASSMDFFDELNAYIPDGSDLTLVSVQDVIASPQSLAQFDSLVVANDVGDRTFLGNELGIAGAQANAYFAGLKSFAQGGGNLVLTDAAVKTAAEVGIVSTSAVKKEVSGSETTAANYAFQISSGTVTYNDAGKYPLAAGVKKPGTAEQQLGRRQAVEPAPLGYSPDYDQDLDPQLANYGVTKTAWNAACALPDCTVATTLTNGSTVNLGEARLGAGRVRIAGVMLPNPVFAPDDVNDHRFGLSDYALTYTGWQVFENLINYRRA